MIISNQVFLSVLSPAAISTEQIQIKIIYKPNLSKPNLTIRIYGCKGSLFFLLRLFLMLRILYDM